MTATAQSRRNDPQTSLIAAERHERSGALGGNCAIVLELVRTHDGWTYRELAELTDLDRHEVMKRLNDLRNADLIHKGPDRKSRVGRGEMTTWWFGPLTTTMTQAEMF